MVLCLCWVVGCTNAGRSCLEPKWLEPKWRRKVKPEAGNACSQNGYGLWLSLWPLPRLESLKHGLWPWPGLWHGLWPWPGLSVARSVAMARPGEGQGWAQKSFSAAF